MTVHSWVKRFLKYLFWSSGISSLGFCTLNISHLNTSTNRCGQLLVFCFHLFLVDILLPLDAPTVWKHRESCSSLPSLNSMGRFWSEFWVKRRTRRQSQSDHFNHGSGYRSEVEVAEFDPWRVTGWFSKEKESIRAEVGLLSRTLETSGRKKSRKYGRKEERKQGEWNSETWYWRSFPSQTHTHTHTKATCKRLQGFKYISGTELRLYGTMLPGC